MGLPRWNSRSVARVSAFVAATALSGFAFPQSTVSLIRNHSAASVAPMSPPMGSLFDPVTGVLLGDGSVLDYKFAFYGEDLQVVGDGPLVLYQLSDPNQTMFLYKVGNQVRIGSFQGRCREVNDIDLDSAIESVPRLYAEYQHAISLFGPLLLDGAVICSDDAGILGLATNFAALDSTRFISLAFHRDLLEVPTAYIETMSDGVLDIFNSEGGFRLDSTNLDNPTFIALDGDGLVSSSLESTETPTTLTQCQLIGLQYHQCLVQNPDWLNFADALVSVSFPKYNLPSLGPSVFCKLGPATLASVAPEVAATWKVSCALASGLGVGALLVSGAGHQFRNCNSVIPPGGAPCPAPSWMSAECIASSTCNLNGGNGFAYCAYAPAGGESCSTSRNCGGLGVCTSDGICWTDCDDHDPCTSDACTSFGCTHVPLVAGTVCGGSLNGPCGALNRCDGQGHCNPDQMPAGTVCASDGNPCTDDVCNGSGACGHPPNTATCNDDNACSTGDVCSGGVCRGTPLTCDDNNPCTNDSCDPLVGCTSTVDPTCTLTAVTDRGDPQPPQGFFGPAAVRVEFDQSLQTLGIPPGISLTEGEVRSSSSDANTDYAIDSPYSALFSYPPHHITLSFDATQLGGLPRAVGLVFTDLGHVTGANVTVEAWSGPGRSGSLLASVSRFRGDDGTYSLDFDDDSFFGIRDVGPIASIHMTSDAIDGGLEADVLRYELAASGCADGTREGFLDPATYPNIAGCSGGWSVPGVLSATTTPACSRLSGNDTGNPSGVGCNVADLCAPGWHVCSSAVDIASHSPTGCTGATPPGSSLFFTSRQSSNGCDVCATGARIDSDCSGTACTRGCMQTDSVANDIYGCGSLGSTGPFTDCGPIDRGSQDTCRDLPSPWSCACQPLCFDEAAIVTKNGTDHGGALCCRDYSNVQETITLPVDGTAVWSATVLQAGVTYQLRVSGTLSIGGPGDGLGDAEYADFSNPPTSIFSRCNYDSHGLDFGLAIGQTNGTEKYPYWGPYNSTHSYIIDYIGQGQAITFHYFDCPASDNSGSLTVEILGPTP